jgi:hypothetical protein
VLIGKLIVLYPFEKWFLSLLIALVEAESHIIRKLGDHMTLVSCIKKVYLYAKPKGLSE